MELLPYVWPQEPANTDQLTVNDLETFYYSPVDGRFTNAPASRKGNNITFTPVPGEDVVLVVVAKGLIETEK